MDRHAARRSEPPRSHTRTDAARRATALALSLLIAACRGVAPREVATAPVRIENPDRLALSLWRVEDDDSVRVAELGDGKRVDVVLPRACYWIAASGPECCTRVPLPLHPRALLPARVAVTIRTPPPQRPGRAFVPAGPCLIGDELGVGQEDERPARIVDVPAFWIGTHEVTNAEFAEFLAAGAPIDPAWVDLDSTKCRLARDASGRWVSDAPDLPVVTVSHAGAVAFCAWRTRRDGATHRLPSEVEWEKAARGPESFVYAYGNVYRTAAANQESGALRPVGSHPANGFGLHDTTGNAFEWVADAWARTVPAGRAGSAGSAADGSDGLRVLRGGSFVLDGMYLRNSFRMRLRPSVHADDIGFRVAVDADPEPGPR